MILRPCGRAGLTLLEVVIAMAIFLVSLVGLSTLVNSGTSLALDVQQQAEASMLCQSKLAEVIVGSEVDESGEITQNRATWRWTVDKTEGEIEGLYNVRVTVRYERQDGTFVQANLSQMVLEPSLRGSTILQADPSSSSSSSSSNSPTTESGSSSPTTPSTGGTAP